MWLPKLEKLRVAGAIAPTVRRGSNRRVTVVSKSGEPIREMTLDEVQAALAKRQDIEFSVRDDAPQTVCAGWDGPCPKKAKPSKTSFRGDVVGRRGGAPWRCSLCANRKRASEVPPAKRTEAGKKSNAKKTPEQRSEAAKKAHRTKTDDQRSKAARLGYAAAKSKLSLRTSEQRSEAIRKGWATRRTKAKLTEEHGAA